MLTEIQETKYMFKQHLDIVIFFKKSHTIIYLFVEIRISAILSYSWGVGLSELAKALGPLQHR